MSDTPPYVVTYDRSRFPRQLRRADGTWGCRGCGGVLTGRRTAWCSNACYKRWCPAMVIYDVKQRDAMKCVLCGFDIAKALGEWYGRLDGHHFNSCFAEEKAGPKPRAEYDHIIPFSEGGLTILENMRTLCRACHLARTKAWHGEKAASRRKKAQPELTLNLSAP